MGCWVRGIPCHKLLDQPRVRRPLMSATVSSGFVEAIPTDVGDAFRRPATGSTSARMHNDSIVVTIGPVDGAARGKSFLACQAKPLHLRSTRRSAE